MLSRVGLLAKKIGMSSFLNQEGSRWPVTLLEVSDLYVVGKKTKDRDGYSAIVLGTGNNKRANRATRKFYEKKELPLLKKLCEFRVPDDYSLEKGVKLCVSHFIEGQYVDVVGICKGKGFSGGMKRHNFSGLAASHGVTLAHRSIGSTGQCQDIGRVHKGRKMPGQLGNVRVTMLNLLVVYINKEKGLLALKGAIPGGKGAFIMVRDAVKKPVPKNVPFPAGIQKLDIEKGEAK